MPKQKFIIKDWAGNTMNFGEFNDLDAAQEFLLEKFPDDKDLQEYFIDMLEKD